MTFGAEGIFKNLAIILEARGKKNTDRTDQLKALARLHSQAESIYAQIRVLLALISAYFDYNPASQTHMTIEHWNAARERIDTLLILLQDNREYLVQDVTPDYDDLVERSPAIDMVPVIQIRGNVISLVERIDDEFTKSLQNTDPHSSEYVERLRDEKLVYATIVRASGYYQIADTAGLDGESYLARSLLRRLEHLYSKVIVYLRVHPILSDRISARPSRRSLGTAATGRDQLNIGHQSRKSWILCQSAQISLCATIQDLYSSFTIASSPVSCFPLCTARRLLRCT